MTGLSYRLSPGITGPVDVAAFDQGFHAAARQIGDGQGKEFVEPKAVLCRLYDHVKPVGVGVHDRQ